MGPSNSSYLLNTAIFHFHIMGGYSLHKWPYNWVSGVTDPYQWRCNPIAYPYNW